MADAPHVQYRVVHQHKSVEPDETGNLRPQWRIHYESPSGTRSYVDLPAEHYTPRNVHDAISQEMSTIEAVNALDGTKPPPLQGEPGTQ